MMPVVETSISNAKFLGISEAFDWQQVAWEAVILLACIVAILTLAGLRNKKKAKNSADPMANQKQSPSPVVQDDAASQQQPQQQLKPYALKLKEPQKLAQQLAACTDRMKLLNLYPRVRRGVNWSKCAPEDAASIFTQFCAAAGSTKHTDLLFELLADMCALGVPRTSELYTSLLKIFAVRALFKDALVLWRWMREDEAKAPVTAAAWSCLVFAAKAEKDFAQAVRFFEKLRALEKPSPNDYCNVIGCLVNLGEVGRAVAQFRDMREVTQEEPDVKTFNDIFNACCAGGRDLGLAEQLLNEFPQYVDVITYNTLIKGFVQASRVQEAFAHLAAMQAAGLTPTAVTFGTLMDACIGDGDLEKARQIFKLVLSSGCELNTVIYTTLIKGFVKFGKVDEGLRVYEIMLQQDVQPDRITYSTLLKALCDANNLKRALGLFEEMRARGHEPDEVIFNNLVAGCVVCKNMPLAEKLVEDMKCGGIRLTAPTISHLLKLYSECQEHNKAFELFEQMESLYGLVPDQRLYMQLIFVTLRVRRTPYALARFAEMLSKFGLPKESDMFKILQSCTTFNLHDTAVLMLAAVLEAPGGKSVVTAEMLQLVADRARKKKSPKEAAVKAAIDLGRQYGLRVV